MVHLPEVTEFQPGELVEAEITAPMSTTFGCRERRSSSMNILLAPEDWLDENTVCLDDRRHEHIRSVLKAEIGMPCAWVTGRTEQRHCDQTV